MTSPEQLAYAAALHAIVDQASVLESLRTRAGNVFAATALVTSFFGGFLLSRTARSSSRRSRWKAWPSRSS